MEIGIGTKLGRYEIQYQLGAGGMGKVYFALDTQLGRPAALKLLPEELTNNRSLLRRFEQEARLTSGLNHPNILTVYEIGHEGSVHYIATEFIDGWTLRSYLTKNQPKLPKVLDIGIQIASALAAAHDAGIVHRDIKPENVMLRKDDYVKVLDFGLAKLTESKTRPIASPDVSTLANLNTDPGVIIGTVLYMSPEQLRGQKVDAGTDIWSFGVILYEMVAGQPPFDWSSKSDAIAAILAREPPPLTKYAPESSIELQRIIARALRKEKEERYHSIKDMLLDLKQLKLDLDSGANLVRSEGGKSTGSGRRAESANNQQLSTEISPQTPQTNEVAAGRATSNIDSVLNGIKNHRRTLVLLALLILIGGVIFFYALSGRRETVPPLRMMEFNRLVINGNVKEAAISPDGRYVASIIDEVNSQSLWVRQINTSNDLQVIAPSAGQYKGVSFSPDGDYIFYLKGEGDTGALYRISVLGGVPRRLASNVDTPVTFSPNGDRLAFVRYSPDERSTSLVTAEPDGSGEKTLASLRAPKSFNLNGFYSSGPAWSPDGSVIAVPARHITGNSNMDVVGVQVKDGTVKAINTQTWSLIEKLIWLSDGSGLLMNANTQNIEPLQIWFLSYPSGEARRITRDPNLYIGLSSTSDSNTLLTTKSDTLSTVWVLQENQNLPAKQVVSSKYAGLTGITWTPEGKIVFASNETGSLNIWIMAADGSGRKQLTFGERMNMEPVVSPDGRYLVYVSYAGGMPHLWRTNIDGANPKQLTSGTYEDLPRFSPDGEWIIYHSIEQDKDTIRKVSIEGGESVILVKEPSSQPDISPDGKLIACFSRAEPADSPWRLAVFSIDGGPAVKTFDLPASVNPAWPGLGWAPDGLSVTYVSTSGGVSNMWSQPLSGAPSKQLTNFQESEIFSFAWSRETRQLACVRGTEAKELFLVKGFR